MHGFAHGNGMWMYDPKDKAFWLGRKAGHETNVEESTRYSECGEENYSGEFWRYSKRFKEFTLEGPFKAEDLRINVIKRKAYNKSDHYWPTGRIASLFPTEAVKSKKIPANKE